MKKRIFRTLAITAVISLVFPAAYARADVVGTSPRFQGSSDVPWLVIVIVVVLVVVATSALIRIFKKRKK